MMIVINICLIITIIIAILITTAVIITTAGQRDHNCQQAMWQQKMTQVSDPRGHGQNCFQGEIREFCSMGSLKGY